MQKKTIKKTTIYTICLIIYMAVFVAAVFLIDDFSSIGGDLITAMLVLLVYLMPVVIYKYFHKGPITKMAALKFMTYYGVGASIVILLILDYSGDSLKPGFIACLAGIFMTRWLLLLGQEKDEKDKSE